MRDHRKLQVFDLADQLAITIYKETRGFPKTEVFGLTSQMRRSAVSVPCNIVEGCARETPADYLHFLTTAYASAKELEYQVSLSARLGFLQDAHGVQAEAAEVSRSLNACINGFKRMMQEEQKEQSMAVGLKPKAQSLTRRSRKGRTLNAEHSTPNTQVKTPEAQSLLIGFPSDLQKTENARSLSLLGR